MQKADFATICGVFIAAAGLLFGLHFEGIGFNDVGQSTAALIVFCGTLGALLISMPLEQTLAAFRLLPGMLRNPVSREADTIETIIRYARAARQRGILSLEQEIADEEDALLRRGIRMAVDAVNPETIKNVLESETAGIRGQAEASANVFETAAGYAPTLGVAGAALGLVQVMKHLEHLEQVGMGVAAAFVATIYGVLLANLVLLPVATKIRARCDARIRICGLVREGVLSIAAGVNPTLIRMKLEAMAQIEEQPAKRLNTASLGKAA
jgi:chemotaxis protein MotA